MDEGDNQPDHVILIKGLNEKAIHDWWQKSSNNKSWSTFSHNCSTAVSGALKAGESKDRWSDLSSVYNTIWTPSDVADFAEDLKNNDKRIDFLESFKRIVTPYHY